MTKYERLVNWFQDNPISAVLLLLLVIVMAIPQVRDGALCIWRLSYRKKKESSDEPFVFKVREEAVTFDELVRSTSLDIVRVNAHTHVVGIMAEHAWIRKRYPGAEFRQQELRALRLDTGDRKAFDVITFQRGRDCQASLLRYYAFL